tara:strand:+ start:118 stop:264 length:147 start_codon:yes stop_codon:yes gene_type:complete
MMDDKYNIKEFKEQRAQDHKHNAIYHHTMFSKKFGTTQDLVSESGIAD